MPVPGDEVTTEVGIMLRAENVQQNRITKVLMTLPEPPAPQEDEGDGNGRDSFFDKGGREENSGDQQS